MIARGKLHLALVGRGAWGSRIARTVRASEEAVLAATAGRDWERLLGQTIDGAVIATPPAAHLPVATRFIERGIPVLVEKPLCLDPDSALAFRDLAARREVPVLVNHVHLFSPAYRLLRQLSPALGRVTRIATAGGREGPLRADTPPLWDWGPHDLAMALDLAGDEPQRVSARHTLQRRSAAGLEANYAIELEFPRALRVSIAVGNAMPRVRRLEVDHERGTLVYDDVAPRKLAYEGTEARVREAVAASDLSRPPLDCAIEAFCATIRAGGFEPRSLDLAVAVVALLERIERETEGERG